MKHTVGMFGLVSSLIVLLQTGCNRTESTPAKPVVIASFYPLYDFARQLCGPNIEVVCLVPPGGDPHGMEATPAMAKQIADAEAVLLLGLGMDVWLDKLARNSGRARRILLSEGIATRPFGKAALAEFADAQPRHKHEELDPHIWLDPVRAGQILQRLSSELQSLYPAQANKIAERADKLSAELKQLDAEFAAVTAKFPRREVVTFHGAFGYLFDRYNLKAAGVIELFPGDQPSAAYLRALVDLTSKLGIKTIFAEPQLPDVPAQIIAREIGGNVERLDPCETILPDAPEATYLERQRKNLETLRRVLGAQP